MRIIYNQPHSGESDDTEGHIERALKELGHEVVRDGEGDIYLFHKHFNPPKEFTGKIVCWYFDKIWNQRIAWFHKIYPKVDYFFMTDGTWARNYKKCIVLRQGIGDPTPGEYEDRNIDVAFVGLPYGERQELTDFLEKTYKKRFKIYSHQFNRNLNNICTSIPIFVAPKFPSDNSYWSNRVYLLVGSGAFLVHPYLQELYEEWGDNLVYYKTLDELKEKVDYYLANPKERERQRKKSYKYCVKNFTYKKRVEKLIEHVKTSK